MLFLIILTYVISCGNIRSAAKKGDIEKLRDLLSHDCDLNKKSKVFKKTALHYASENNHLDAINLLIDKGAEVNILGGPLKQLTPLDYAVLNGNYDTTLALINRGALINHEFSAQCKDYEFEKRILNGLDEKRDYFLERLLITKYANKPGSMELKELLQLGGLELAFKIIKTTLVDPRIIAAVESGFEFQLDQARQKIEGPDFNILDYFKEERNAILYIWLKDTICDQNGVTPLMAASYYGYEKIVEIIFKAYPMVYRERPDNNGNNALHYAAKMDRYKTTTILLKKHMDLNAPNKEGTTPFQIACGSGAQHFINAIRDMKKEFNVNHENNEKSTGLHQAVKFNHPTIIPYLISLKCDTNIQNIHGDAPIHLASKSHSLKLVEALFSRENKPKLDIVNIHGETPLHLAFKGGVQDESIARFLILNGAKFIFPNFKINPIDVFLESFNAMEQNSFIESLSKEHQTQFRQYIQNHQEKLPNKPLKKKKGFDTPSQFGPFRIKNEFCGHYLCVPFGKCEAKPSVGNSCDSPDQLWNFLVVNLKGSRRYQIQNYQTKLCLTLKNDDDADFIQKQCDSSDVFQLFFVSFENGYDYHGAQPSQHIKTEYRGWAMLYRGCKIDNVRNIFNPKNLLAQITHRDMEDPIGQSVYGSIAESKQKRPQQFWIIERVHC